MVWPWKPTRSMVCSAMPCSLDQRRTAASLHVGHLLQIMLLRWWQKTGHKPIALMGAGTTKVGDPSGRDETRQLLTNAQIDDNMASIKKSFANYLKFGNGSTDAVMVNN